MTLPDPGEILKSPYTDAQIAEARRTVSAIVTAHFTKQFEAADAIIEDFGDDYLLLRSALALIKEGVAREARRSGRPINELWQERLIRAATHDAHNP